MAQKFLRKIDLNEKIEFLRVRKLSFKGHLT